MREAAIGIFDSGLGGLTTVREIRRLMPQENIVYFGDTSRVPYGTRSAATIEKYAAQDVRFLLTKGVKMIVVACGTASAHLPLSQLRESGVPYTGVVLPTVKAACAATRNGRIGVIATPASIKSGVYRKAIAAENPDLSVLDQGCPMFVPLVENGYARPGNPIATAIAKEYLEPLLQQGIDTLIMGCTHYPLLRPILADIAGPDVVLIDAGQEGAKKARELLLAHDLQNQSGKAGQCAFYVSDNAEGFAENAAVFLQSDVDLSVETVEITHY